MKTLTLATALILSPALAFAMGCKGSDHTTTAASCPAGQTWNADTSTCVDAKTS